MEVDEKVEMEKGKYLEYIKSIIGKYSHIVIYGAGRKGVGLYHLLYKNSIAVEAFFVTNKNENKDIECGLKIYAIEEAIFPPNDTLVLIGVRTRWNKDVVKKLEENGYSNYIEAPDGIEYFSKKDLNRNQRKVLQITTQIGCSISCRYCPQKVFIRKYLDNSNRECKMSFELFKKYINHTENDVILEFAGFTEPFFNNECVEMLLYADKRGYDIELFTTLKGITIGDFKRIESIPYREVVLHIPDKNNNSKIEITKEYLELLKYVINLKKSDGKEFVDWASCHGEPADEIKYIIHDKIRILTQLHDRAGNLNFSELEQKHNIKGAIQCSGTLNFDHNVLLPDGTVLLCDSDWEMKHIIGNLQEMSYLDILHGDRVKEIQRMMSEEDSDLLCRSCCYAIKMGE